MASFLIPPLKFRGVDANGLALSGGKLYTYIAGTSTPKATYVDFDKTPNTNPIFLDANGEADVRIETGYYKFVLKDANDVVQWTIDKIGLPSNSDAGVPTGGDAGQVLTKITDDDYEYDWVTPTVGRAGKVSLSAAVQQVIVTFSTALASTSYAIAQSFENVTDADPIFLQGYVSAKSTAGFTFKFNAPTDSANYVFHYTATVNA
jgi:hypothetical protein